MADATPGVLYNNDWYMTYDAVENDRLWISEDQGKTWVLRDDPEHRNYYNVSYFEGLLYKALNIGYEKWLFRSSDYGNTWQLISDKGYAFDGEYGFDICEFIGIGGSYPTDPWSIYYTNDCFDTYSVIPIGEYVLLGGGIFPDVFRGGLPGEVYVTSASLEKYIVAFSADTGYQYRVVHQRKRPTAFMSDQKAGDFYLVTGEAIETQQPRGWYLRACIEHYTDYGETLAGIFCHDLTREGVVTAIEEVEAYSDILVFPNPTRGEVRIENGELRIENVEVFDLIGKSVGAYPCGRPESTQNTFDISKVPSGIYFIRIQTETGVVTKKVVKQ
jgi:hypothetical protein